MSRMGEIVELFDTYIALCYEGTSHTPDNCGALLLDEHATEKEAKTLLGKIRTNMSRKYNYEYWAKEEVPRPSVFYVFVPDLGWKFYLTKGLRSTE